MKSMKKRLTTMVVILSLLCTFGLQDTSIHADQQTGKVVTQKANSTVNVRKTASLEAEILCALSTNTEVTVMSSTQGADGFVWYKIQCKHPQTGVLVTGYMRSDYVEIQKTNNEDSETALTGTGTITANNVYVREHAGTDGKKVTALDKGDAVEIIGQTNVAGAVWYHVRCTKDGKGFEGYTHGDYILIAVAEDDDNGDYKSQLKKAGFPDSYIPYLVSLHAKYPNWKFVAVNTGLKWSDVIAGECARNDSNLVSKTADDSMKSTASGAYNWKTNTWTLYDSERWVAAHPDYVAYYMDPRNFLDATNIFQFEALSYSDSQTLNGVKSILKGTFMAGSVVDADRTTLNYASTFMKIGKESGVSPYHLAARVIQEQGVGGTSVMISGTYSGYTGYYNYFNIGASGQGQTAVITNGLAYAKKQGWNTRYKSLQGGAATLAKNYIARGQDTLYFEKFNVIYKAGLYSHQYMQNLLAAYNEGRKMANGYADKTQTFVFRIPVYQNMPSSAVTFTSKGNPNNYLKSLSVSGQSLTPAFNGDKTSYTMVVPNAVSSIKISATAVASTSKVSGTGTYNLDVGDNKITVKCKSQSGVTRSYIITVTRQKASDDDGDSSVSSSKYRIDKYITGVALNTKASTFLKNITAKNCTVKLLDATGSENKGTVGTGNKLAVYENGKLLKIYGIVIYGDANGDGDINALDLIKINRHILGKASLSGCYLTAADANKKGDGVNALDLIVTNNQILGRKNIAQ